MLYPVLGPKVDVPAPDVNTTPEIMSWMIDEYKKMGGDKSGDTFTGKPLSKGGSEGRGVATGMGGFYVFEALKKRIGFPKSATVAIQGMGNVGGNAAKIFSQNGHRIIAISDSQGGVYNEEGLDIGAVEAYKIEHRTLLGFSGGKAISNAELLELPWDLLIPAVLENQINEVNADKIKAKAILELANGPITPEADNILFSRKITVVPDILANAGGVVVSTFEWEQNLKGKHWTEKVVLDKLQKLLFAEAVNVWKRAKKLKTDLRRGAFVVAIERLGKVL